MNKSVLMALCLIGFQACQHDPITKDENSKNDEDSTVTENCDADTVYFQNTVLPILVSNCTTTGCHDATTARDGVNLTNYNSIISTSDITKGAHNQSKLYEVLVDEEEDRMPPSAPLSSAQINNIAKWIDQGAKNNKCTSECDISNVNFSTSIMPIIQSNCIGCRSGSNPSGGITPSTYNNILSSANSGKLMGVIQHSSGYTPMPPSGSLTTCQIKTIKTWIENGKLNN